MKFPYYFDCHIHSDNSIDGNNSVTHLCETAVEKGLQAITITDHCEVNLFYNDSYYKTVKQSFFEINKAAIVFKDSIRVLLGIELGQPTQDVAAAEVALSIGHFDFVIASQHNVKGKPDFAFLDYEKENADELLKNILKRYYKLRYGMNLMF